ncbi:MAG: pyridoxal phosphate-dependent aminotransferase [Paludibacteraceae bacterium]|nr:pyridoxal phosphate-dependent aminotransferase [Paludibacteraceae bacterium]MBQ6984010.1 pyridoxal phosphate-dependent aminotransferase [Paludibacteraceae bacterium]
MIQISNIANGIQTSFTRQLFNMAKEYDDVIDFTLGDPDVQTHDAIKAAACRAIEQGKTRYSQNAGLLELRQTIAKYYNRKEGLSYRPEDEIMVTVGAMEGLYLCLLAMLNPDDEVIIPAPYYVNYTQMVAMCHAKPVIVDNPEVTNLTYRLEDIEHAITPRTRAIMINTPSNPTGRVLSQEMLAGIAEIAMKHDLVVISDEVYKCLIYGKQPWKSIAHIEGMRERTILVNSLSKEFCMTGYRIGYVLGPSEIITAMTKLQENVAACAPLPSQYAAIEALGSTENYSKDMVRIFTERKECIVSGISAIDGLTCREPDATFYLMVDISSTGMNSVDFAIALLKAQHVAVVPGITYGKCCDHYVRIAFTRELDYIREGVKRIDAFMKGLKK